MILHVNLSCSAQVATAFSVIRASRVLSVSQGDWRLWDWHCIALLLDAQLTSAPVLSEVLAKTQFMQRLGEAFGHFAAGVMPADAQEPDLAATPGVAAIGPSGTAGSASLAAVPWTPAALRLVACARQWLLLLAHHPAGRDLLLARGAKGSAAAQGQASFQVNFVLELALGLWAQLSRSLRGLLLDNATTSRVAPASGLAASAAGRLLVSAASRAFAAFGSGGPSGDKLFESPEAAATAVIKDIVGAGASGQQHVALFGRTEFQTTAAREFMFVFGALASTERGREILQVRAAMARLCVMPCKPVSPLLCRCRAAHSRSR